MGGGQAAGVSQNDPREPRRAIWVGHSLEPRPQFHDKESRKEKERNLWREKENRAKC